MVVNAKTIFYVFVGALWAIASIFVRWIKKITAHFWSDLVTLFGHIFDQKVGRVKFCEKIRKKLVKWPLSAHF